MGWVGGARSHRPWVSSLLPTSRAGEQSRAVVQVSSLGQAQICGHMSLTAEAMNTVGRWCYCRCTHVGTGEKQLSPC